MSVGSQIRAARKAKKITQETLANEIGRTKGSIANYENGVSSPSVDDLMAIMRALDVDANYIYEWDEHGDQMQKAAVPKDDGLSPHEREVALAYRAASDDDKAVVDAALKKYIMLQNENSTELAM